MAFDVVVIDHSEDFEHRMSVDVIPDQGEWLQVSIGGLRGESKKVVARLFEYAEDGTTTVYLTCEPMPPLFADEDDA